MASVVITTYETVESRSGLRRNERRQDARQFWNVLLHYALGGVPVDPFLYLRADEALRNS
jgi:hypothetical protein